MSDDEDVWPEGDVMLVWDDVTRTVTDHTDEPPTSRPYTDEENAAADERVEVQTEDGNEATLTRRAADALAANRAFLAIASPTAAQNAAQAKALTKQMNALIRLALRDFSGTD